MAVAVTTETMAMPTETYPEHEKLRAISDKSQAIGEFLEWADAHGMFLARYQKRGALDEPVPVGTSVTELLAEFYGIDLTKIETEKRAMLDAMRRANKR